MSDVADVFKGLPRRIHVGGYTFRVQIAHQDVCSHLDDADGMTVFSEQRIYLREDLSLQLALNTVMHEVTHVINWVYGVNDDSTEETFTTQHTNGQLEVWMRNPRLLTWQTKQLRQIKKESSRD